MATRNNTLQIGAFTIKNLDDLKNRFNKEAILALYENFDLQYFLKVNGYLEELQEVNHITSTDPNEINSELVRIFNITINQEKFERKMMLKECKQHYDSLINEILDNNNNIEIINNNLGDIIEHYKEFIEMDYKFVHTLLNGGSLRSDFDTYRVTRACLYQHKVTRNLFVNYLNDHKDHFVNYIDESFNILISHLDSIKEILKDQLIISEEITDKYDSDKLNKDILENYKGKKYAIFYSTGHEYTITKECMSLDDLYARVDDRYVSLDGYRNISVSAICGAIEVFD